MGYYSEVALCLDAKAYAHFEAELATQSDHIRSEVKDLISWAKRLDNNGNILFHWDFVKWYESFPCVGFIMNHLNSLPSELMDSYCFSRIGEELDDNEQQGHHWDNPFEVMIERSIHCIGKKEKKDA